MDIDRDFKPFDGDDTTTSELGQLHSDATSDARPRRKRARTLRESDWEPYKDRIKQLHVTEKRPLPEVKMLMEQEFSFTAEIRQYRSRLSQWKLDKNIKPEEMKAIIRHRQRRGLVETDKPDLKFRVRGQEVEPQKIERWMKRHDISENMVYAPSPALPTPSAVSYATMSEVGSPGMHSIRSPDSVQHVSMNLQSSEATPRQEVDSPCATKRQTSTEPLAGTYKVDGELVQTLGQYSLILFDYHRDALDILTDRVFRFT
ncbi:Clr5 domain-containing protein [Alternaria rosae]|uniref:Clr5 domain-containing protein n=1 Tax=Alternaria rosae TaxID=1187941 RepID=UPI001E8CD5B1|nr:Clr5 domain-containing protein [Alternaria rosae]KAH6882639.1 Clr5 domain-containing protein [Alternaria rosae]